MKEFETVSMKDIERSHKGYWFRPGNISFSKSKVGDHGYVGKDGVYFVSSEKNPDSARAYTIRRQNTSGSIVTVGEYMGFPTRASAVAALKETILNSLKGVGHAYRI